MTESVLDYAPPGPRRASLAGSPRQHGAEEPRLAGRRRVDAARDELVRANELDLPAVVPMAWTPPCSIAWR